MAKVEIQCLRCSKNVEMDTRRLSRICSDCFNSSFTAQFKYKVRLDKKIKEINNELSFIKISKTGGNNNLIMIQHSFKLGSSIPSLDNFESYLNYLEILKNKLNKDIKKVKKWQKNL